MTPYHYAVARRSSNVIRRMIRRAIDGAPTDGDREYEMDPEELDSEPVDDDGE